MWICIYQYNTCFTLSGWSVEGWYVDMAGVNTTSIFSFLSNLHSTFHDVVLVFEQCRNAPFLSSFTSFCCFFIIDDTHSLQSKMESQCLVWISIETKILNFLNVFWDIFSSSCEKCLFIKTVYFLIGSFYFGEPNSFVFFIYSIYSSSV